MSKKKFKPEEKKPKSEQSDTKAVKGADVNESHKVNAAISETAEVSTEELEGLRRKSSEFDQLTDRLKRVAADFQNYRRRAEQERESWTQVALQKLVLDLLPVFDDLDRAIAAIKTSNSPEDIASGIRLIESHLSKVLESYGVQRIHCLLEPFDPTCHEAVEVDESQKHPDPIVLHEYQRGYRWRDRVIKPAKVRVSGKAPAKAQEQLVPEDASSREETPEDKEEN